MTGLRSGSPTTRRWLRWRTFAVPLAILLALCLVKLNQGDWRGDTPLYAGVGLWSVERGEWGHLAVDNDPYFNKPPLAIELTGLSLWVSKHWLGGPDLWAARLPTVLAAAIALIATIAATTRLAGRTAGLMTGLVLALTVEFFRRTREASLDMWQLAFLMLALWLTVLAADARTHPARAWWACCAGAMVGLALLCKPLVALAAIPMLIAWALWCGRPRRMGWGMAAWLGASLLTAIAVAAPWHVAMVQTYGEAFTSTYFGDQVADRAAGGHAGVASPQQPVWFYAHQIATTYWPWLVFVALALVTLARGKPIDRDGRAWRLAVVWGVGWFLVLTLFPDRRDRYALVLWPALAMLAGLWLSRWPWPWLRRVERGAARWGVVGAAMLFAAVQAAPVRLFDERDRQWDELWDDDGRFGTSERRWIRIHTIVHLYMPTLFTHPSGVLHDRKSRQKLGVDMGLSEPVLWVASAFDPSRRARVYLEQGIWLLRAEWVAAIGFKEPLVILYHRRDGKAPGPNEHILATYGDLTVSLLIEGSWQPIDLADPGESER